MAKNKVIFEGRTLIDLTNSTVEPKDVERGKIFYDVSGEERTGIAKTILFDKYVDTNLDDLRVIYENSNLVFDGTGYIDTNIALFSSTNIDKDFTIIFEGITLDNSKGSGSAGERCLVGAMYEVSPYPGFVVRVSNSAGAGVVGCLNQTYIPLLIIKRVNGQMVFSAVNFGAGTVTAPTGNTNIGGGGVVVRVGNMSNCKTAHNTTMTLGCEKNASGNPYRYCGGSIEYMVVAMAE